MGWRWAFVVTAMLVFACGQTGSGASASRSEGGPLAASAGSASVVGETPVPLLAEMQRLVPSDSDPTFPGTVALWGDTLMVSALETDTTQLGAVYSFVRSGAAWTERQKLRASDGINGDQFGTSITLTDDAALIAILDNPGSLYAFTRSGSLWQGEQKLTARDGTINNGFGVSRALSNGVAIIGAPLDGAMKGAAYVFVRSGTTWTATQKLVASDGQSGDRFGQAILFEGDAALVAAPQNDVGKGAAYSFRRVGTAWTERQKLVASENYADDRFGTTLALAGDALVIGAPMARPAPALVSVGAVYSFTRTGELWAGEQRMTASDGVEGASFGSQVAISETALLVGAPSAACGVTVCPPDAGRGAVYAFSRPGATWANEQKITLTDGLENDRFGWRVLMSGERAIVSVQRALGSVAYSYTRAGVTWGDETEITPRSGMERNGFGILADVSGQWAALGSTDAVYMFALAGGPCASSDDCATGYCSDGICCDTACAANCDVCTRALGSSVDGRCEIAPAGYPGDPICAPLACTGASLDCMPCNADAECAADRRCAPDHRCRARIAKGSPCNVAPGEDCLVSGCRACAEGLTCADGVCCDSPCSGCSACLEELTGEPDGTCAPIPAGQDPREECEVDADFPESCLGDGNCDGGGNCRDYAPRLTVCGDVHCSDGALEGPRCSGDGDCESIVEPCFPYACVSAVCRVNCSSDSHCASNAYCADDEACAPKKPMSADCAEARECGSGHCADGVCCMAVCSEQCEACAEEGTVGTCTQVLGEPRGERPSCGEGRECRGGECVDEDSLCADDGVTLVGPGGEVDCTPYACIAANCAKDCDVGAECAPGHRCTSDRHCVKATTEAEPDPGCGCRSSPASPQRWWLFVTALLGLAVRRRRGHSR